jgi:hypothetical protein
MAPCALLLEDHAARGQVSAVRIAFGEGFFAAPDCERGEAHEKK